jgi:hypothetical protein
MREEAMGGFLLAILFFVFRIVGAIYCAQKAIKLNRNPGGWAVFGLFLPIIAMIWVSNMKKVINWHEDR